MIYFVGTFLVTMLGNVPINKRLDLMVMRAPDTRDYWQVYARDWTRWNHLRTGGLGDCIGVFADRSGALCLNAGLHRALACAPRERSPRKGAMSISPYDRSL